MGRSGRLASLSSVALAAIALAAAPLRAGTLNVPGDSPTIQGAIVLAASGDTILVAPGTYVETIDFLGKQLVIQSTGGAAVTTIDAAGGPSAVTAKSAEPEGTALRGFTLTGGTGQSVLVDGGQFGDYTVLGGGGLCVSGGAHLDVSDCAIAGNTLGPAQFARGGGVVANACTLSITDCSLSGNFTEDMGAAFATAGGGVTLTMSGCTVTGNTALDGAAIYIYAGSGTVTDCVIADNSGTGLWKSGYGVTVKRCTFYGNTEWGYFHYADFGADVLELTFLGNGLGGANCAGGKYVGSSDIVNGCIFAGDTLKLGNSFADVDSSSFDGATILCGNAHADFTSCIIRGAGSIVGGANATANYSDIEGGFAGTGNIDADPLWVNAAGHDYHLLPASPCIGTGDPSALLGPDMGGVPFPNAFADFGGGVAGSAGTVALVAHSTLVGGEGVYFKLTGTPPSQPVVLILGTAQLGVPFKGGTLWPVPSALVTLVTNGAGQFTLTTTWPPAIPSGFKLFAQYWYPDAGAIFGFAGSNGVRGIAP